MQVDLTATEVRVLTDLLQHWEVNLQAEQASNPDAPQRHQVSLLLSLLADLRHKFSGSQWSTATCSYCGTQFVGVDPTVRFCSDRCRRRFERLSARAIRNIAS